MRSASSITHISEDKYLIVGGRLNENLSLLERNLEIFDGKTQKVTKLNISLQEPLKEHLVFRKSKAIFIVSNFLGSNEKEITTQLIDLSLKKTSFELLSD